MASERTPLARASSSVDCAKGRERSSSQIRTFRLPACRCREQGVDGADGHASTRAAPIYLHVSKRRSKHLADGLSTLIDAARSARESE
jgi:hypothetical protein